MNLYSSTANKALLWLLAIMSVGYLAQYLVVAVARLAYPFELEWMEAGTVEHIRAILGGEPIYRKPSLEFVSYIYGPVYFYLSAAVALLTGVDFTAPRLVSLLASLGFLAVLYRWVQRETDSRLYGLFAAGLLAAAYGMTGAWYDLARVDSLFMFLTVLAAYVLAFSGSTTARWLGVLLMIAAVWTKQTALFVSVPLFVGLWIREGRSFGKWVALYAGLVLASFLALNAWSDGWMGFYLFEMPASHEVFAHRWHSYWWKDIFLNLPVLSALAIGAMVAVLRGFDVRAPLTWAATLPVWFWFAWGLAGGGWPARVHPGGALNTLIPASFALALAAPILLHKLESRPQGQSIAITGALAALVLQFAWLYYPAASEIPTAADRAAGERLLQRLAAIPGEVWMVEHTFILSRIDKPTHANGMALWDILRMPNSEYSAELYGEVEAAIMSQRFTAVVSNNERTLIERLPVFYEYYELSETLFDDPDVLVARAGKPTRPDSIWVPKAKPGDSD